MSLLAELAHSFATAGYKYVAPTELGRTLGGMSYKCAVPTKLLQLGARLPF
jgi:hypothetical protein